VAFAPVCVEKFQRAADASANLVALKKVDSWMQGDVVEKGGWQPWLGRNLPNKSQR